jgi:hypothetical protein
MSSSTLVIEKAIIAPPTVPTLGRSAKVAFGAKDLVKEYASGTESVFCVADALPFLRLLVKTFSGPVRRSFKRVIVLHGLGEKHSQTLRSFFGDVVSPCPTRLLKDQADLMKVLTGDNPADLLLGGMADEEAQAVVLIRGNLESLTVPFDWFASEEGSTKPDFRDLEVIDCGQTLRLGEYEAATDAILYAFDAEYRKRAKANALEQDESFGGALKRLRLSKGLTRNDFPGVSAKEIARIEGGKIEKPHRATLEKLAKVLRVRPEEIESY